MVLKLDDRTLLNNENAGDKKRCKTEDVGSLLLVENAGIAAMQACICISTGRPRTEKKAQLMERQTGSSRKQPSVGPTNLFYTDLCHFYINTYPC